MAKDKKSSFLEMLGNAGNETAQRISNAGMALLDGIADASPIVGMPVQALLNTKGYQDRELRREANKQALIAEQVRLKEYMEGAPSRKKARAASDMQADEYMGDAPLRQSKDEAASAVAARAKLLAQEDMSPEAVKARSRQQEAQTLSAERAKMLAHEDMSPDAVNTRKQQRDAEYSRAKLAEEIADQTYMNSRSAVLAKNLETDLAKNPEYSMLSFAERKDFAKSPRTQALIESKFYLEEIMKISGKDPEAFKRMDRTLKRMGWSLVDGEDGIKYLDMGGNGRMPATKEGIEHVQKVLGNSAKEELFTRARISDSSSLGDPALRSIAQRTRELMPFNNNDATASNHMVEAIFNQSTEEEKGWHMFSQAIKDYNNSGLPPQAKMAGIQKCLPFLKQLGYAVDFDPKNPDPSTARIYDIKNKKNISFGEFAEVCKKNDTLSATFDNHFRNAGVKYEQMQKKALLKQMKDADKNLFDGEKPRSKAFESYRQGNISEYTELNRRKSEKLEEAFEAFSTENADIIVGIPRTPTEDDLENLRAVDLSWKKTLEDHGLDPSKLPSPVQDEIYRLELPALYKQREALASSPDFKGRETPLKAVAQYAAGGLLRQSNRRAISSKIQLTEIENKIKVRESALKKNAAVSEK